MQLPKQRILEHLKAEKENGLIQLRRVAEITFRKKCSGE